MTSLIDGLCLARAEIHGIRAMLQLSIMGEKGFDAVDSASLAESAENRINAIIETGGHDMKCILKRADYLELTETAGAATRATTEKVLTLSARLMATLNPAQRSIFAEVEELTSLEAAEAQDGLARGLCGCSDCRGAITA